MWLAKIKAHNHYKNYEIVDLDLCKLFPYGEYICSFLQHENGRTYKLVGICERIQNIEELKIKLDLSNCHLSPHSGLRDQDSFAENNEEYVRSDRR